MRSKSMLAFALAIGCGLVAMVGVQQALRKKSIDMDADKVVVYVAATEIMPGQAIDMAMLAKQKFLKTSVPKDAVLDPKLLEKRAFIVKMMPGDIVRADKLGAEGKMGASISIPPGMRVVSISTTPTQAHSGMIQPGDRVDVMVTYKVQPPSGGRDYPETKTILGKIEVFATDAVRDSTNAADGTKGSAMKNVSLLVTPEQAQTLQLAVEIGTISLNLRNASDTKEIEITTLNADLFRNAMVSNGIGGNNDPTPQPEPRARPSNELNDFLNDASGKPSTELAATGNPDTEQWEIAFYKKDGMTIETVEVKRREVPPPAETPAPDESGSVVNSLMKMFQAPTTSNPKQSAIQNQSRSVQAATGKAVGAKPTASSSRKSPAKPKSTSQKTPRTVSSTSIAK